jgi:hypothetical protein
MKTNTLKYEEDEFSYQAMISILRKDRNISKKRKICDNIKRERNEIATKKGKSRNGIEEKDGNQMKDAVFISLESKIPQHGSKARV